MSVASQRARRLRRIIVRARQAPPAFLVMKARTAAFEPLWNALYMRHASRRTTLSGALVTRLSPDQAAAEQALAQLASVFKPMAEPSDAACLVARARAALGNRVEVLGFGELDLGSQIDWHRDYVSGYVWPPRPGLSLDYVQADRRCDVKVAWEINRLQMLMWLAQGHVITAEPAFVDHLQRLLEDWIQRNPVGVGIAWSCTMEVAIRSFNMAHACALVWAALSPTTRSLATRTLREHHTFMLRHPELSDVNGNHYVADLCGTVGMSAILDLDADSSVLRTQLERLVNELMMQVHEDGGHHENALGYHRLVTELVLHAAVALRDSGRPRPRALTQKLVAMLHFAEAVAGAEGVLPTIGDSDTGQVVRFDISDPNSIAALRALAGSIFSGVPTTAQQCAAVRWVAVPPDAGEGLPSYPCLDVSSHYFRETGYVVLSKVGGRVVLRAGDAGLAGRGAHDHADLTSFTLELAGVPVVVDPGCSTYTGDPGVRRWEISAFAHNGPLLGGRDPFPLQTGSVMDVVSPRAAGRVLNFWPEQGQVMVTHNGYPEVGGEPAFSRSLALSEDGRRLNCVDEVFLAGAEVTRRLLIAPVWTDPQQDAPRTVVLRHRTLPVRLIVTTGSGSVNAVAAEVAETYGSRRPVTGLLLCAPAGAPAAHAFSIWVQGLNEPVGPGVAAGV